MIPADLKANKNKKKKNIWVLNLKMFIRSSHKT